MPPAGYPAFLQYLQSGRVRKLRIRLAFGIRQRADVSFQLRQFLFRLVIAPGGKIPQASDPCSQFVQAQRHGVVRPAEDPFRLPHAPVQVIQCHLGLKRPALGSRQLPGGILERRDHFFRRERSISFGSRGDPCCSRKCLPLKMIPASRLVVRT